MALNKTQLKADLVAAFTFELGTGITTEQSAAIDRIAGKFADAIDNYVKTGRVQAGIDVVTDLGNGLGQTVEQGIII